MADADVQQALQALAQLGAVAGGSKSNIQAVGQSMARLRAEMQRGTGTIQSNSASLQRLMSDFEGLDQAARRSTAGQSMLAEQTKMAGEIMRNAAGQMTGALLKGGMTEAVDYVTKQLYASISSYQDGASGIQTAFNIQNSSMESSISVLGKLSAGAEAAAATLALIPGWYAKGAAALAGLVSGATGFTKEVYQKGLQGQQLLQKEIAQSALAFDTVTKGGALFSTGIAGLRQAAGNAELRVDEFTKVVIDNRKELHSFGGSVTAGVSKFNRVSTAFKNLEKGGVDLRKELLLAGYSAQEQADGVVDFMDMMNKAGRLRGMTDTDIAKQSTDYLKNLRAISAFTGEDAKQAQKRAQQASEQLAVQAKLSKQGPGAFERFTTAVASMGPEIQKGLQQMTAFDGTIVDKSLNQLLAASPTRKKLLEESYADMQNSALTATQVNERYQKRVAEYGEAMKKEALAAGESYGAVTLATGAQSEVTGLLEKQVDLGRKGEALKDKENTLIGNTVQELEKLIKVTDPLNKAFDPLTASVVNAERAVREDIPKTMTMLSTAIVTYFKTAAGGKGPAGIIAAQKSEMGDVLGKALNMSAKIKPVTEPGGAVSGLMTAAAETLLDVVGGLSAATSNLIEWTKQLPVFNSRDLGTLGMTGNMFEKQDFFGKIAKGETVLTPNQLENLVKGVGLTGMQSAEKPAVNVPAIFEKLSESVKSQSVEKNAVNMPEIFEKLATSLSAPPEVQVVPMPQNENLQALSDQFKESFAQSMANFQQQKLQVELPTTSTGENENNKLVEKIQEVFTGQNGFNQMLSSLTGQLETNNGKQIAVLQEQIIKLEELLSAMQDNVDYSKRIADNIV